MADALERDRELLRQLARRRVERLQAELLGNRAPVPVRLRDHHSKGARLARRKRRTDADRTAADNHGVGAGLDCA
jgi:hypothetical protein